MALGKGTSRNFNIRGAQKRVNEILRTELAVVMPRARGKSEKSMGRETMAQSIRADPVKDARPAQRSTQNNRWDL